MKKIFLFIILSNLLITTYSQTNVSGTIGSDAIWTKSESPYILTGAVVIPNGITLTIEAGVVVQGAFEISSRGKLLINGNGIDSVIINTTKITFKTYSFSESSINKMILINGELKFDNSINSDLITIKNSRFNNSTISDLTSGAINFDSCYFNPSTINGSNSGILKISNSTIKNSFLQCYGGNYLVINNSSLDNISHPASYNIKYNQCKITNSSISFSSGSNELFNSTIKNSPIGAYNGTHINNCLIIYNKSISPKGYSNYREALTLYGAEILNSSIITNKGIGVVIQNNSTINYCTFRGEDTAILVNSGVSTINNSNFLSNNYNVVNKSTSDQTATSNYWGTNISSEISKKIYDIFDDALLGQVVLTTNLNTLNASAPILPPTGLIKRDSSNGMFIKWNKNKESDIAGYKIYFGSFDGVKFSSTIDVGIDTSYLLNSQKVNDLALVTAYDNQKDNIDDLLEGHESWFSDDILPNATILNGDSIEICQGSKIKLRANKSESYKYQWLKDGTAILDATTDSIEVSSSGQYQIIETNINNAVNKSKAFLLEVHQLSLQNGNYSIVCGASYTLSPSITYSGDNTLIYSWTADTTLSSINIKNPIVNTKFNHIYNLSVTDGICSASAIYNLTVNPLTVNLGTDKTIVCGGKVQFDNPITNYTGPGNLIYSWSPKNGLDSAKLPRPTAEITINTTYALAITTSNGCLAKDTVKVNITPLTVNLGPDKNIICGGKIQFDNPTTNYTGSENLIYSWSPKNGLDSAKLPRPTSEVITNTSYVLNVLTPNGCIAKDSIKIMVNPLVVTTNDILVSCGNSAQLNVATNYTGSKGLSYNWSPSSGLSASNIPNPYVTIKTKANYSVEVKTFNGCSATANVNVSASVMDFIPSICMVTVNDNDKNEIVWERNNSTAIDSFFIFRESTAQTGQYDLIGKLPYLATGVFVDTFSNARVQSNKYKIAVKDVCGFITNKSSEHKTMHLTINKGTGNKWNLIWEQYVGLSVSSYKIFRGTNKTNLLQIGSSSGGNTTYTDETAPTGDVYYQIEVVLPQACTNFKSTEYDGSRSNIMSSAVVAVISDTSISETFIYPNPAFDKLNIINIPSANMTIMIFDLQGKQVLNKRVINGQIDISYLAKGIYTVRLINTDNIMINKLVKL